MIDAAKASSQQKQRVAIVVTHELAHQVDILTNVALLIILLEHKINTNNFSVVW